MMNIPLVFYPELTREMIDKIGFQAFDYELEYTNGAAKYSLKTSPVDSSSYIHEYLIEDDKSEWTADQYDLCLKRQTVINKPEFLFGENGVACRNSELGLALMWTSKTSNQQGVEIISGFKYSPEKLTADIEYVFPAGQLRGKVKFQTVLFLKTPGQRIEKEDHLANESGIILGSLDDYTIVIDGKGSVFPIVEVSEASQPLWWVECYWNDPMDDLFDDENVVVCLNKAHTNYPMLKLEDGLSGSPMLVDIIADAIQIIIQKAKESDSWEEVIKGKNMETGSIAKAIHYFIETFSLDYSSPEKLALTIRRDFDKRF